MKLLKVTPFNSLAYSLILLGVIGIIEIGYKTSGGILARLGYLLLPLSFIIFVHCSWRYIKFKKLWQKFTRSYRRRSKFYLLLITLLALYGFLRGNPRPQVFTEFFTMFSCGIFMILGADDEVFEFVVRLATVLFWMGVILTFSTLNIPHWHAELSSGESLAGADLRYTNTVAYLFRSYVALGLPLFLYSLQAGKSGWRYFQFLSVVGYIAIFSVIFKFRSSVFLCFMVLFIHLFFYAKRGKGVSAAFVAVKKMKWILFILLFVSAYYYWSNTQSGSVMVERFSSYNFYGNNLLSSMFGYRWPESERMFEKLGVEILWGRGMGGGFDLGGMFGIQRNDSVWQSVHIGWFVFLLKGGVPLFVLVLSFWFSIIAKKSKLWLVHSNNVVSRNWCLIVFITWWLNPIAINFSFAFMLGVTFMMLGRGGLLTRPVSYVGRTVT